MPRDLAHPRPAAPDPTSPILVVGGEGEPLAALLRGEHLPALLPTRDIETARRLLPQRACSVALIDVTALADQPDGDAAAEQAMVLLDAQPGLPVIVVNGADRAAAAVACLRRGAYDYLPRPLDRARLVATVRQAAALHELRREGQRVAQGTPAAPAPPASAFSAIVTVNRTMQAVFKYAEVIATTSQPVLITGETGTGKDLIARAVHQLSRRQGEMVPVNIAGLDDTVFSDSLFGHCRGAFTDAGEARAGLIQRATNGTLFLDEIGDLTLGSQVKLLRLLQDGDYFPLGADQPKRSNARIIVATSHDLQRQLEAGTFRKDLFYRLRTHHIHLQPLRERRDDIEPLARHFIALAAEARGGPAPDLDPEALRLLGAYVFPGNVRELKALMVDAVSRGPAGTLSLAPLRQALANQQVQEARRADRLPEQVTFPTRLPTLKQVQDLLVAEALRRAGDNQAVAAHSLGVTRQALNKRILGRRSTVE